MEGDLPGAVALVRIPIGGHCGIEPTEGRHEGGAVETVAVELGIGE
jgi:hypothetical protein